MNEYVDYYFHELAKHGTKEFPLAIYGDTYNIYKDRFFYMHCHEELEAIIAIKGEINVLVNQTEYIISGIRNLLQCISLFYSLCPEVHVHLCVSDTIPFGRYHLLFPRMHMQDRSHVLCTFR